MTGSPAGILEPSSGWSIQACEVDSRGAQAARAMMRKLRGIANRRGVDAIIRAAFLPQMRRTGSTSFGKYNIMGGLKNVLLNLTN
jgi:hypothetical protein